MSKRPGSKTLEQHGGRAATKASWCVVVGCTQRVLGEEKSGLGVGRRREGEEGGGG